MPILRFAPTRFARLLAGLVASAILLGAPAFAAEGEQWEYTTQMEVMGMKMPMPPGKICRKPGESTASPQMDKNCEVTQLGSSGSKTSFAFKCGKPHPMEGKGEAVRNGDAVTFTMNAKTAQGDMNMVQNSRKVGKCTLAS